MEVWLVAGVAVVVAVGAYVLLSRRGGGEIIDAPRPASSTSIASPPTAAPAIASEDLSAGDMLKADGADGSDPLVHFADWLESEASEELGTAAEQAGPTRRIADAARAVMPVILAQGRGVVDLPSLVSGRDFRREIDIPQLERAVAHTGFFDVNELTEWRRDRHEVRALASWLEDQVFDDMPSGDVETDDDTVRVIEAARQAVADIDSTGRAEIALIAIGKDSKGQTFDTRRAVDAERLRIIVAEYVP
jgi:hypothetical protein